MGQFAAVDEYRAERWTLPDLIDFDHYVEEDEGLMRASPVARQHLSKRDRRLYRNQIARSVADLPPHTARHRSQSLLRWLVIRRAETDPALRPLLPGVVFARGQRLAAVLAGIIGCLLGVGIASALLYYDGQRPVNVSWYLLALVLLQSLLAAGAVLTFLWHRLGSVRTAAQEPSLVGHLVRPLISKSVAWVRRQRLSQLRPDLREHGAAQKEVFQAQIALYGPVANLPLLMPAQCFGIGFNLGAVAITLALVWFSDLAFGWGSTLEVTPETIHEVVRFIALPWSWFAGDGLGYPTLEQIAGSRINLKNPLMVLQAEDLRSWRWFLLLSLLTYGLVPRLLLLVGSVFWQRWALGAVPFTHERAQSLYARMLAPVRSTSTAGRARAAEMPIPPALGEDEGELLTPQQAPGSGSRRYRETQRKAQREDQRTVEVKQATPSLARCGPGQAGESGTNPTEVSAEVAFDACILLIPIDIANMREQPAYGRLHQLLHGISGWRVAESVVIDGGSPVARQAIDLVRKAEWSAPPARVAIIQDASQPPITEGLRFLREVRLAAGKQAQLLVALVGDPQQDNPFPPVRELELDDWRRKIERLADPYLRLALLAGLAEEGT